jgi:hypothetical protein
MNKLHIMQEAEAVTSASLNTKNCKEFKMSQGDSTPKVSLRQRRWTQSEIDWLKANYPTLGKMACADHLGRTEGQIRWKVSELQIKFDKTCEFFKSWQVRAAASKVGKKRPEQAEVMRRLHAEGKLIKTPEQRAAISVRCKKWIAEHGHPRGSKGLVHSEKTRRKISEAGRRRWENLSQEDRRLFRAMRSRQKPNKQKTTKKSWKSGCRVIGCKEIYFRSSWEANYARYLEMLKNKGRIAEWEHEAFVFEFEDIFGVFCFVPDFKVTKTDGSIEHHEVKGWMDDRSQSKLKAFKEQYPKEKLVVINAQKYKAMNRKFRWVIDGWEHKTKTKRKSRAC